MPNWCENTVTVYFPTPEHENFFHDTFSKDNPFNTLIPEPEWSQIPNGAGLLPVKTQKVDYDFWTFDDGKVDDRWYEWRIKHWGAKWDVPAATVNRLEYYYAPTPMAIVSFDTAWCPPAMIAHELRARGFIVSWYYNEPGMAVRGFVGETMDELAYVHLR